jgi:hypothetical protein
MQQLVRVVRFSLVPFQPGQLIQLKRTKRTNCCVYTLLPADERHLANPIHLEVL